MAKKKKIKLNSMRVLEAQGVPYEVFTFPPTHHSAVEVAELARVPPAQVYKTLVVQRERGKSLLVMVAGGRYRRKKGAYGPPARGRATDQASGRRHLGAGPAQSWL